MKNSSKPLALRVVLFAALTTLAACADSMTSPRPVAGRRAGRDTVPPNLGDTINCHSGYMIIGGRVVCSDQ